MTREDVTDLQIYDLQYGLRPDHLRRVLPLKGLTPARERVLSQCNGMKLGYWSQAAIYSPEVRSKISKKDHKIFLGLVLGGYFTIWRVPGPLNAEPLYRHHMYHFIFEARGQI